MKTNILRASFLVLSATLLSSIAGATAAACTDTTLAAYITLGATGCTINGELFSNFAYTPTNQSPTAAFVNVTVDSTLLDPGLNFGATWGVIGPLGSNDFHLSFTVDVLSGALIDDDSLGIDLGNIVGADSEVSVNETVCLGGNFGNPNAGTGCLPPNLKSHLSVYNLLNSNQDDASQVFAGSATYSHIQVFKDIALSAPSAGDQANFSSLSQNFSLATVPEPVSFSLMGIGLLGIGLLRKRIG